MNNVKESDEASTSIPVDVAAAEQIEDRIAKLDKTVIQSMARRHQLSIDAGRALNELKKILGHGKWLRHFEEVITPASGLSLRRAERYMRRARKFDLVSNSKPASDQGARDIRDADATEEVRAEMASAVRRKKVEKVEKDPRHIYKLPLRMTANEKQVAETLQALPDWPHAEKEILSLLRRLWLKYGIVNKDGRRHP